jgi:hypothetical protein
MTRAPANALTLQSRALAEKHGCQYALEHRFHPDRRWRFDVAFPSRMIAAEIDGAVWTQGRHTRGRGFIRDQEKTNEAQLLGWRVFRFVPDDLDSGRFLDVLDKALAVKTRDGNQGGHEWQESK